jgi:single-strand DNA-binding protein
MRLKEREMADIRLPSVNHVLMSGRLTADPNLNFTPDGVPVLKFRIASGRMYRDKDGNWKEAVAFIPVTVWREQAERLAEVLHKGSAVFVEGRLQSRSWEVEGQRKSMIEINAWRIQNLEKSSAAKERAEEVSTEESGSSDTGEDDDLPF